MDGSLLWSRAAARGGLESPKMEGSVWRAQNGGLCVEPRGGSRGGSIIVPPSLSLIIALHMTLLGGTPRGDDFCQFCINVVHRNLWAWWGGNKIVLPTDIPPLPTLPTPTSHPTPEAQPRGCKIVPPRNRYKIVRPHPLGSSVIVVEGRGMGVGWGTTESAAEVV